MSTTTESEGDPRLAQTRLVASAIEPFAAQVYFSKEAHERYVALGFAPSPAEVGGVAMPDGPAYFTSRGSILGQVPGELVASAFGVFSPAAVVPAVAYGWTLTDAPTIRAARAEGAVTSLRRILGERLEGIERVAELLAAAGLGLRVEGRPLYAGLAAEPVPDEPLAAAWLLADRLREYRGDSHTAAWISAGIDATEIGLLSELYWGLPMRSYSRTRAWTDEQFDAAEARLTARGLLADGGLTDAGRAAREAVELTTDAQCVSIVDGLGDGLDELLGILRPWGAEIRAQRGYLQGGPHDLAAAARPDQRGR